jgi:hypothetical protein
VISRALGLGLDAQPSVKRRLDDGTWKLVVCCVESRSSRIDVDFGTTARSCPLRRRPKERLGPIRDPSLHLYHLKREASLGLNSVDKSIAEER